ncbi:MAG: membrane protein insertase YidC [Flavobacteriales bacterium]
MKFDKNTLIGGGLMVLLILGFVWYQNVQMKERAAIEQQQLDSLSRVQALMPKADTLTTTTAATPYAGPDTTTITTTDAATKYGLLAPSADMSPRETILANNSTGMVTIGRPTEASQKVVLENNNLRLTIDTRGGLPTSAELLGGYKVYGTDHNIKLWDDSLSSLKLLFSLYGKGDFKSDQFKFVASTACADARTNAQQVNMRLNTTDPSKYLEIVYQLAPQSYNVSMKVQVHGMGGDMDLAGHPLRIEWYAAGHSNERGIAAERTKCTVFYREAAQDRDYLSETSSDQYITEQPLTWMAFKQDYFSAALYSNEPFPAGADLRIDPALDSTHTKYYWANMALPARSGADAQYDLNLYLGPNDYTELNATGVEEFHRIIDYGWSIIGVVNRYCVRPLFWFFSTFIGSWGLIILLVTIVIKTVLFPITWKNFLSSAKMRVLKPEIEEINKRYEGKPAGEKQTAMMALYRQTGVNPFAGCIPVLIQMPILYAMFRFFPAEIVLRGKSFLWADDLAAYDSIFSWTQNIPVLSDIYGNHISGFTILMCISTFIYTKMSMGAQPAMPQQPGMPNMKVMMNLFTVMMLFFFNNQPSGLALYYFIANMVSISQMWAIKKYFINEDAIRAKIDNNKKKPKTKSGFMQRLEEAQKGQRAKLAGARK